MKNHIDSNFAIAILTLVSACVGFAFWLSQSIDDMPKVATPSSIVLQEQNVDIQRDASTLTVVDTSQVDTSDWVDCMVGGQEWMCPPGWISHDTSIQNFPENETFGANSITIGVGGAPVDQNITEENFSFYKDNATNELKEWSGGDCITLRDEEFATLLKCVDTSDDGEYLVRYNSVSRYDNANDVIGISQGTILISASDIEVYERNEEIVTKIVQEFSISDKQFIHIGSSDISVWQESDNGDIGISLKYPQSWVETNSVGTLTLIPPENDQQNHSNGGRSSYLRISSSKDINDLTLGSSSQGYSQGITTFDQLIQEDPEITIQGETVINNIEATEVFFSGNFLYSGLLFENEGKFFVIEYDYINEDDLNLIEDILDSITLL